MKLDILVKSRKGNYIIKINYQVFNLKKINKQKDQYINNLCNYNKKIINKNYTIQIYHKILVIN